MLTNSERKTILVVSHINPANPTAGNERRLLNLTRWLRREGYCVELLLNSAAVPQEVEVALEGIFDGIHTAGKRSFFKIFGRSLPGEATQFSHPVVNSLSSHSMVSLTSELCQRFRPAAVIAEYVFAAPCLSVVPDGILKIVDTHDVFSRRNVADPHYCSPELEQKLLLYSDVIMAIQSDEAMIFAKLVPERETITAGIDYDVLSSVSGSIAEQNTVLLVGSDNDANIDGLHRFFCFAWPRIRSCCPSTRLRIVGKVGSQFTCSDNRVEVAGWVESLDAEYAQASVVINPTIYGTGLKVKTVEALCHGKPLVGTPNSIEGLSMVKDPPWLIGDDWQKFADHVIDLMSDSEKRQRLKKHAISYSQEVFAADKVYAELKHALQQLEE